MKPCKICKTNPGSVSSAVEDEHGETCSPSAQSARADDILPPRTRELIVVGISVATGCESYIKWRVEQAVGAGVNESEVREAIWLGMEMAGDTAHDAAQAALDAVEGVFGLEACGPGIIPREPSCSSKAHVQRAPSVHNL